MASDLPAILHAMKEYSWDETIQAKACKSLCQIAAVLDPVTNCSQILEQGGVVDSLVAVLQAHPTNVEVQGHGCGAIRNLAQWYYPKTADALAMQNALAAAGALNAVCSAMKQHPTDSYVQWAGCRALHSLTIGNESNQKQAKLAGAEDVIRTAMMKHPLDPQIQRNGTAALQVL